MIVVNREWLILITQINIGVEDLNVESEQEKTIRRRSFALLIGIVVAVVGYVELSGSPDMPALSYLLVAQLNIAIIAVSVYWWAQVGAVSTVFRWLMLLMSGVLWTNLLQFYARYLWITEQRIYYDALIEGPAWAYRQVPEIVAMCYLLALIISRMSSNRSHYVP